ncbi:RNA-binding protein [Chroococcus sp. FPU101]|uniref:RNA recognition motif domain-containing protein n=1 Tax=Chroococcus sp. FPU101 TaxID=1974212 RepID=UPI001A8C792D|nr:RNA-binding protein [Chroococcus sp. FPU101]GFE68920.1 RNP-1 like RNA-binding protein [Chroococcus sp. FPU101]
MSVRLYVGNLPKEPIERQALQAVYADLGDTVTTKVIKDRKTGKCRGFAFVTVPTDEMADQFIEKYNGQSFMDSPLKIEKALPRTKGKGKEDGEGEGEGEGEDVALLSSEPVEKPIKQDRPKAERPAPKSASKRNNKKRGRSQEGGGSYRSTGDSEGFQPDPRWASELAKLKEMLAAQTTNT